MAQPLANLVIVLSDDGSVQVNGPIENKMLVYGMLDMARDAIREFNAKKAEGRLLTIPQFVPPADAAGNGKNRLPTG